MVPGGALRDVRDPDCMRRDPDGRRAHGVDREAPAVSAALALEAVVRCAAWVRSGSPVLR